MFKSFYDPEVEKRDMKIDAEKEKESIARNFLRDGLSYESIAKKYRVKYRKS